MFKDAYSLALLGLENLIRGDQFVPAKYGNDARDGKGNHIGLRLEDRHVGAVQSTQEACNEECKRDQVDLLHGVLLGGSDGAQTAIQCRTTLEIARVANRLDLHWFEIVSVLVLSGLRSAVHTKKGSGSREKPLGNCRVDAVIGLSSFASVLMAAVEAERRSCCATSRHLAAANASDFAIDGHGSSRLEIESAANAGPVVQWVQLLDSDARCVGNPVALAHRDVTQRDPVLDVLALHVIAAGSGKRGARLVHVKGTLNA